MNQTSQTAPQTNGYAGYPAVIARGLHFDIGRLWKEAVALRFWIFGLVLAGLLGGLIVTLLSTELYRAQARIELRLEEESATNVDDRRMPSRIDAITFVNTQLQLLRSRSIAERVASSGNLERDAEFREAFGIGEGVVLNDRALENILISNLSIEMVPQSGLVDIGFSSPDPIVSAEIANLWAQEFLAANYEKLFGANIEAREALREQIDEFRERLAESEAELINYANANGIVIIETGAGSGGGNETAQQTLVGAELSQLNSALAQATADRITAEALIRAGAKAADSGGSEQEIRGQLATARAQLAQLEANFGPGYPAIKAKRAEVASLEDALNAEAGLDARSARAQYQAALNREQQLRSLLESTKNSFLGQQSESIQYGILSREVETNRQLYDALLQRLKTLEAAGAGKNNMTIVDPAIVPSSPYSPSLTRNLLAGLLLALFASAALVYIREAMDQTIRDPSDVRERLGLSPLGLVPLVRGEDVVESIGFRSSEMSEAYAAARTNMGFLTPDGAPKAVLLTSTRPNEGKSLSSVALARSFANVGNRTLLIDCDLRNSGLGDFLEYENPGNTGLSSLLAGSGTLSDTVISLPDAKLDLLPVGFLPPNPVELLASDRLKQLVEQAKREYDQVIVDGPPVLGLADAIEASKAVDGIIFVAEANSTNLRSIENALSRLRDAKARIFGAIVTKLAGRNDAYGYGSGYGYGHTYGNPDAARAEG